MEFAARALTAPIAHAQMSLFAWKPINIVRSALNRCLEQFARLQMALAGDESTQHQTQRSLHVSDLASPQTISRHHRLEPLPQKQAPAEERKKTRRKKTRRKRQEEVGEQRRGDVDGQEGVSGGGGEDPLLEASTLQQMQARLDPLYSGANSPLNGTTYHQTLVPLTSIYWLTLQ